MPGQTHDIGRRKWEASKPERQAAERRRAQKKKLVRRRKLRASRVVDPTEIATWRNAKKAERT